MHLSRVAMLHTYAVSFQNANFQFIFDLIQRRFFIPSMHQRRPYYRGGTYSSSLPASYRNKALFIVGVTVLYTAWLHQKGGFEVILLDLQIVGCRLCVVFSLSCVVLFKIMLSGIMLQILKMPANTLNTITNSQYLFLLSHIKNKHNTISQEEPVNSSTTANNQQSCPVSKP